MIVGGTEISVSKKLLTSASESALCAMFSGLHELEMEDGLIKVDRDPFQFDLMLEYLKNGRKPMNLSIQT